MPHVHDKETWIFNDDGIVLVYCHSQAGSRKTMIIFEEGKGYNVFIPVWGVVELCIKKVLLNTI